MNIFFVDLSHFRYVFAYKSQSIAMQQEALQSQQGLYSLLLEGLGGTALGADMVRAIVPQKWARAQEGIITRAI